MKELTYFSPERLAELIGRFGRALHRPAVLPVPALALRMIFGQAAEVLLASQRVVPAALERLAFPFTFPALDAALADVLGGAERRGV